MSVALFITEQFIKENTAIDGNVDSKYLEVSINDAQRIHILPILGTGLYNEVSAQILAANVSGPNQTLLNNYIQDALKYWVLYEGIDQLHFKITNKGVMTKSSDNSQPIEQLDVIRLMDRNKERAEYFSQRLTEFLIANIITYPLFANPGSAYDTIRPTGNNYTIGWNLGDPIETYGLPIDYGKNRCWHE